MFFSGKTTCKTILRFSPCLDKETLKKQFHVMFVQIHSPEAFKPGLKSRWCEEFVSYWSAKPLRLFSCHHSRRRLLSLDTFGPCRRPSGRAEQRQVLRFQSEALTRQDTRSWWVIGEEIFWKFATRGTTCATERVFFFSWYLAIVLMPMVA